MRAGKRVLIVAHGNSLRALVKQFDKDKDGCISKAEAEEVTAIRVTENWEIASVEGIASFPNLKTFEFCGDFEHTRPLTGLDVSANTKLEVLNLSRNELESLDVRANTALRELNIAWNGGGCGGCLRQYGVWRCSISAVTDWHRSM